jgi:divalent metal cation (Fe/Co/Zn/Cd) transporter
VSRRQNLRFVVLAVAELVLLLAVLLGIYAVFPVEGEIDGGWISRLVIGLTATGVLLAWEVNAIQRARRPMLRATRALISSVLTFLMVFALTYVAISTNSPSSFSTSLDKTESLYFTVTTFATVGYGDITPTSNTTRIIVTVQMLLDLAVIAVTARLLFNTASGAVDRRKSETSEPSS